MQVRHLKEGIELELSSNINDKILFEYSLTMGNYNFKKFIFNGNDYSSNQIPQIQKSTHKSLV